MVSFSCFLRIVAVSLLQVNFATSFGVRTLPRAQQPRATTTTTGLFLSRSWSVVRPKDGRIAVAAWSSQTHSSGRNRVVRNVPPGVLGLLRATRDAEPHRDDNDNDNDNRTDDYTSDDYTNTEPIKTVLAQLKAIAVHLEPGLVKDALETTKQRMDIAMAVHKWYAMQRKQKRWNTISPETKAVLLQVTLESDAKIDLPILAVKRILNYIKESSLPAEAKKERSEFRDMIMNCLQDLSSEDLGEGADNLLGTEYLQEDIAWTVQEWYEMKNKTDEWNTYSQEKKAVDLRAKLDYKLPIAVVESILGAITNEFQSDPRNLPRLASISFGINDDHPNYLVDFEFFKNHVDRLFQWHKRGSKTQKEFMAPYFPVIQSSGMGKTKLFSMYQKWCNHDLKDSRKCVLLVCKPKGSKEATEEGFDDAFAVPDTANEENRDYIIRDLNSIVENRGKAREVVLLFDEAQELLNINDAWPFRCVRWWLRQEKDEDVDVVASFAGTTSMLSNFYNDPLASRTSRVPKTRYFGNSKGALFDPFFQITTTGLLHRQSKLESESIVENNDSFHKNVNVSEYKKAIPHGRPLFALLSQKGMLNEAVEFSILRRMVLSDTRNWKKEPKVWFSILATRAQMGQVDFSFASDIVALGYGSLSHFRNSKTSRSASVCFFPDPVCARLAMGLMMENHTFSFDKSGIFRGLAPQEWMQRALELFSGGLCRQEKGNIGEVVAGLYLLFCGDVLRRKQDPKNLENFSVPLKEFLALAQSPNEVQKDNLTQQMGKLTVNFIQISRNYMRLSVKQLLHLLPTWYEAGRAVYAHQQRMGFDIIIPVRNETENGKYTYAPLLVSVKNREYFRPSLQEADLKNMSMILENDGISNGHCMTLLLGCKSRALDTSSNDTMHVVIVPKDDVFGVCNFVEQVSIGGGHEAEVFVSHHDIAVTNSSIANAKSMLRSGSSEELQKYVAKIQNGG